MLITLCYLYLWARWGRRPAALVRSTVRRLRASRCSFTFCRAAAQPGGALVCLSRGGRVFCVGESQVGGGRGRRVDGARRRQRHCNSARTAHACTGAWEALLCPAGRGPAAPPSCLRCCTVAGTSRTSLVAPSVSVGWLLVLSEGDGRCPSLGRGHWPFAQAGCRPRT